MSGLIPPGSIILTPADCRVLVAIAHVDELRRARGASDPVKHLLTHITIAAFSTRDPAEVGREPRQSVVSEESRPWTTSRLARAAGCSERKIRDHCATGTIRATRDRPGAPWVIDDMTARAWLETRRTR